MPATKTTVAASDARLMAQKKLLTRIRRKYAKQMGKEMKRVLRGVNEAMAIQDAMRKEFADALGDDGHDLHKDATFEPYFTPGFKETKFLVQQILHEIKHLCCDS